jgi:DNA-nicking Smr family endonuclease
VHAAQPRGSSQGVNVSNVPTAGGRPTRELEPLPMPMTAVPTLTKVAAQRHQLNPRSMFLLDQVDGMCSVQDLIDISGMSQAQALEVLRQLLQEGWIELR